MGLRIQTNISSVTALRNLTVNDRAQQKSLERLSTGFRINRASDDPAGLVISERLRAQIRGLGRAVENSENASNLIGTAEAALQETASLLTQIRGSIIFAMSTGSASPSQIAAEQAAVDSALSAIDRIANTTRFGDRQLLNGAAQFQVISGASAFDSVEIHALQFGNLQSQNLTIQIAAAASQAFLEYSIGTLATAGGAGSVVFRVTGSLGTAEITVQSGAGTIDVRNAVNQVTDNTGVVFGAFVGPGLDGFTSVEYGSTEAVRVDMVSGEMSFVATGALTAGSSVRDTGSDAVATLNGAAMTAHGLELSVANTSITTQLRLDPFANTVGPRTLRLLKSGLDFQLNQAPSLGDAVTLGIGNFSTSALGEDARALTVPHGIIFLSNPDGSAVTTRDRFGFLGSLRAGGVNDLFENPRNALRVVDSAIEQVSRARAFMGGLQAFTIDTNIDSLEIAIENLTASESAIRDLDFAEETSSFTRTQILFQASTAVLGNANLIPQSVLSLLR